MRRLRRRHGRALRSHSDVAIGSEFVSTRALPSGQIGRDWPAGTRWRVRAWTGYDNVRLAAQGAKPGSYAGRDVTVRVSELGSAFRAA